MAPPLSNRRCDVEGCNTKHYAKGLCLKHYTRLKRRGTTVKFVRPERPVVPCSVDGCDRVVGPKSAKGLCESHYSRLTDGLELTTPFRKYGESHIDSYGYRFLHITGHPLSRKSGYVAEHRAVAYEKYGDGTQVCHWCEADLGHWCPQIEVDHLDGDRLNNHPDNLVTSCAPCNRARAGQGNPVDFEGYRA